jgi:flagellar L-ring protein precursor FlgH
MSRTSWRAARRGWLLALLLTSVVSAQTSGPSPPATGVAVRPGRRTLADSSWTYLPPPEPRRLQIHDLIVVLVDEKTQVISEGEMDRKKKADSKFVLKDWIGIHGGSLGPDMQEDGDPAITGELNGKFRAEAGLETRDSMKFRIACQVVDIRPNGNVLLEGRRLIHNNEDTWEMSLIGMIRPEDILPNNTVLSENVADLRIVKRESGHVRDAYRRGWLTRFLDRFGPF